MIRGMTAEEAEILSELAGRCQQLSVDLIELATKHTQTFPMTKMNKLASVLWKVRNDIKTMIGETE